MSPTNDTSLPDAIRISLVSAYRFNLHYLEKADELHWLATDQQRAVVILDAYALLTQLVPDPIRMLTTCATLIVTELLKERTFVPDFCIRDGIYGATAAEFSRNLAGRCLSLALTQDSEHSMFRFPTKFALAALQFDPALLARFNALFRRSFGDDLSAVSPALRQQCDLVLSLYETPDERYQALTAMLHTDKLVAPGILVLPDELTSSALT